MGVTASAVRNEIVNNPRLPSDFCDCPTGFNRDKSEGCAERDEPKIPALGWQPSTFPCEPTPEHASSNQNKSTYYHNLKCDSAQLRQADDFRVVLL